MEAAGSPGVVRCEYHDGKSRHSDSGTACETSFFKITGNACMGTAEGRRLISPFVENEKNTQHQTRGTDAIVPLQFLAEISDGEDREHGQRNYFLDGLELRGVEFVGADTVCRYLETIFEKCDSPTGENYFPQRLATVFQVAIPREGHKDIGDGEKQNGAHEASLRILWKPALRKGKRQLRECAPARDRGYKLCLPQLYR